MREGEDRLSTNAIVDRAGRSLQASARGEYLVHRPPVLIS